MADELALRAEILDAPGANVDPFEALRILSLRLAERDLSTLGAFEVTIRERRAGFGWTATLIGPEPALARIGPEPALARIGDATAIELRLKSDIGALELAGHSLSSLRSSGWKDRAPGVVRVRLSRWESTAPTVPSALAELRRCLARLIEDRIAIDMAELRRVGVSFDVGGGWGETRRLVDPTVIDMTSEGSTAGPRRLPG